MLVVNIHFDFLKYLHNDTNAYDVPVKQES